MGRPPVCRLQAVFYMDTKEVFEYLMRRIHSVVAATADEDGLPVTCVVDIMDADDDGLYFSLRQGKAFITGFKEADIWL